MNPVDRIAEARELLSRLNQRLIAGEIDEPAYDRLRERNRHHGGPDRPWEWEAPLEIALRIGCER